MLIVTAFKLTEAQLNTNYFLWLLVLCTGLVYFTISPDMAALYFSGTSLLACLMIIYRIEDHALRNIILFALALRVSLALIQAYTGVSLPGDGRDSINFEEYGWQNAQAWLYGGETGRTTGAYYYSALIGGLYYFFGRIPFIPLLVNVYFSLATIYFLYRTNLIVFNSRRIAQVGALLLIIIPTLHAYSAVILRETIIIFFCVLSFYYFTIWLKQNKLLYVGFSFIALVVAGALHGPIFLLIWVYLVFICFFSPREQKFKVMYGQLIPAGIIIALSFLSWGEYITYQLPSNIADIFTPEFVRNVVERKTIGRTSYLQGIVPYTYFDVLWQTPLRVFCFLFLPLPWMVETTRDLFGFLDVLLFTGLFIFAIMGAKYFFKTSLPVIIAIFLLVASLVVMFSWGTTNYGTAWRHRQKVAPYLIVLASAGIATNQRFKRVFTRAGEEVEIVFDDETCLPGEERKK